MYDIEFVIPVCNQDKYSQRLLDLKKFGLLNIGSKKVLLTLLVGTERIPNVQEGWPEGVTVRTYKSNSTQVSAKTYSYFSNYALENIEARWIAKIDDDTVNDVSSLVDFLDLEFDHEREYYIVTEFRGEQHKYEDDILKELGFTRWFIPKNILHHELEGSIISQATLKRILINETAVEFMRRRSEVPQGFNDYALACAARICKVYPTDAYFMSRWPVVGDLTLFGGTIAHIHAISHDANEHVFDLFQRMLKNDMSGGCEICKDIVEQEYVFRGSRHGLQMVKLHKNGILKGSPDAQIWHMKQDGTLEFLKSNGTLVCMFKGTANVMEGIQPSADKVSLRRLATS